MQGETAERWRALCAEAAIEQDHKKLLELTEEINRLLAGKEQRLKQQKSTDSPRAACLKKWARRWRSSWPICAPT